MNRHIFVALLGAVLAASASVSWGQADARAAFDAGKTAYLAGDFDKARDQFLAASRTDTQNPEVFLWLGRTQYQLGAVNDAVAAWTTTLRLAPNEPYATKMLAALRSDLGKGDVAINFIDAMVKAELYQAAAAECEKLLGDKALTDGQRVRVLAQKAEALLGLGRGGDVPPLVEQLLVMYPNQASAAQTNLLLGRAYVRMEGRAAEGLALLKKVVADQAAGAAGVVAQYELIRFDLAQGPTPERVDALAKWLAANQQHALARDGRRQIVEAYLRWANESGEVSADSPLGQQDAAAIAAATDVYKQIVAADEAQRLTQRLIEHVEARYGSKQAMAAAIAAVDAILKAPLPRSSRMIALTASARYRGDLAVRQLRQTIATTGGGDLKADPLPPALADAVEALAVIGREFPAQPAWGQQAALAEQVRQLAAPIAWPSKPAALKAPLAWAVQIALPIVKANSAGEPGRQAAAVISAIANETAAQKSLETARLAAAVQTQLVAAIAPDSALYAPAVLAQADLLGAVAQGEFQENRRTGNEQQNAKLSAAQQQFVDALGKLVARDATAASRVIELLTANLQPWTAQGYTAVADEAYTLLGKSIPSSGQKSLRLAVVRVWIASATREHQRLLTAGLAPPRALDPALKKAIEELYALQGGLSETDPLIVELRNTWNGIINHYKRLEYFDTAEQAITTKPAAAVPAADAHAMLQLALLRTEQARRELTELLKQHNATQKLTLTPAYQAAIEAYQKFIAAFPDNLLVDQAVAAIFEIGRVFEQQQAFDVAAGIYRGLATFAGNQKALSQTTLTTPSVGERAAFAAASALDAKARLALTKALAERKPDTAPPAKLSDEFVAAIAAYKDFIKARPSSPLLGGAIQKISAIAVEYANADAWDVADGVYGDLLGAGLSLHNPQRLEFARAMCQLGKAMPEHARQILSQLTARLDSDKDARNDESSERLLGSTEAAAGAVRQRLVTGARGGGGSYGGGGDGSNVAARMGRPANGPMSEASAAEPMDSIQGMDINGVAQPATNAPNQADIASIGAIALNESRRAAQVAQLQESSVRRVPVAQQGQMDQQARMQPPVPVLSEAELTRIEGVFDVAYKAFKDLGAKYPATPVAELVRQEMLVMVGHWRSLGQWQRSASLAQRFLTDHSTDRLLPQLRLQVAQDLLNWAAQPPLPRDSSQQMLAEVADRFGKARFELSRIISEFADQRDLLRQAQWELATSYLTQARAVDAFSPTLSRGQYVRAARELVAVARAYPDHPNLATIPQLLWQISTELSARSQFEESVLVLNELVHFDPTSALSNQAAQQIASIYQNNLGRPLRAVETYLEISFTRTDGASQNAIFQIGQQLRGEKRWVEALSVLETFVDSFPRNQAAGQALTMIGQIHQANEAWPDAITAYKRVLSDFPTGNWVQEAKWSIAECTINLSQWREAGSAYESYVQAYPQDSKVAEANRRIGVLKDLSRYQTLVDEPNHPKGFDAQFQIATIVQQQLANPQKAIIEFRKVATKWPTSHLADDALYAVGTIYLGMGEIEKAREALRMVNANYPDSNLADDALLALGHSYEDEAQRLANMTRGSTVQMAQEQAQKEAYQQVQVARGNFANTNSSRVMDLNRKGEKGLAELEEARQAGQNMMFNGANFDLAAQRAAQVVEVLTAVQLADRQDKINGALRKAVDAYAAAAKVPGGDKAGDALLRMAVIYDEQLKDPAAALATWKEIVNQYSGTAVAEEASWRIAQYHDRAANWPDAVEAYKAFLRNYRRSPKAAAAQFAIAEGYEHQNKWVEAMDAYTNYINSFAEGPLAAKAREQINWIKTYRL